MLENSSKVKYEVMRMIIKGQVNRGVSCQKKGYVEPGKDKLIVC